MALAAGTTDSGRSVISHAHVEVVPDTFSAHTVHRKMTPIRREILQCLVLEADLTFLSLAPNLK